MRIDPRSSIAGFSGVLFFIKKEIAKKGIFEIILSSKRLINNGVRNIERND
jgi:hypothetical protein